MTNINLLGSFALAATLVAGIAFTANGGIAISDTSATTDEGNTVVNTVPKVVDAAKEKAVYVGLSPKTNTDMYVTQTDAPGTVTWAEGKAYCEALEIGGHKDWRLPVGGYNSAGAYKPDGKDKQEYNNELNMIFQHRGRIGNFDLTGLSPDSSYWSSTEDLDHLYYAWGQFFGTENDFSWIPKTNSASVRCVRTEPSP